MFRGIASLVVSALLLAAGPAPAQELKEFSCGRSLEKDGDAPQLVVDNNLHVLAQTQSVAKFDPGIAPAGSRIKSIFCARSDVVPAPSDYKVVAAGYPLTLFARDGSGRTRIAVLETDGGQLRVRSVGQAGFTPDMVQRIQVMLDAAVPQFKAAAR
jgi:hypothetical protein